MQGFSTLALLTLRVDDSLLWGTVPGTVGFSQCSWSPSLKYKQPTASAVTTKQCIHTLPSVPGRWEVDFSQLGITALKLLFLIYSNFLFLLNYWKMYFYIMFSGKSNAYPSLCCPRSLRQFCITCYIIDSQKCMLKLFKNVWEEQIFSIVKLLFVCLLIFLHQ